MTKAKETIRSSGYQSYDLSPNDLLWFSPGTIHRLVNTENLNILVIMQNGGLPEAGDVVMIFEADIVADPKRYASTASHRSTMRHRVPPPQAARIRRDAAFAGFKQLKEAALAGNFAAVEQFQRDAVRLVQAKVPGWQHLWTETSRRNQPELNNGSLIWPAEASATSRKPPSQGRYRSAPNRRSGCAVCSKNGTAAADVMRGETEQHLRKPELWE